MASILQEHPHGSDCPLVHSVSQTLLAGKKELPGQYLVVRYSKTKLSSPGLNSRCSSWKSCMSTLQSKAPPSRPCMSPCTWGVGIDKAREKEESVIYVRFSETEEARGRQKQEPVRLAQQPMRPTCGSLLLLSVSMSNKTHTPFSPCKTPSRSRSGSH